MSYLYGLTFEELRKYKNIPKLKELIDVLGNAVEYNWLLSGHDFAYPAPKQIPDDEDFTWLDGEVLVEALKINPHFIWCVATAYKKNISKENVLQHPLPFADGYRGFWTPEITMQNPLSEVEIIIWHGHQVLIFSKSKEIIDRFAKEYPNSKDLVEDNKNGQNEAIRKALETDNIKWLKSLSDFVDEYKIEKYIEPELYKEMQERIKIEQ